MRDPAACCTSCAGLVVEWCPRCRTVLRGTVVAGLAEQAHEARLLGLLRLAGALAFLRHGGHDPVSYTHLDVYKRQDRHCRDVWTQLAAVSKGLDRAGFKLVSSSMRGCLNGTDNGGLSPDEIEELFLRLT